MLTFAYFLYIVQISQNVSRHSLKLEMLQRVDTGVLEKNASTFTKVKLQWPNDSNCA